MEFDYARLPHHPPRKFVSEGFRFEWGDMEDAYARLGSRGIRSVEDLEAWLGDEDELESVIYEQRALRYFNYTRQTDNKEYETAYRSYTQDLEPKIKLASFELTKKFVASPFRERLPPSLTLECRRRDAVVRVFRAENVELEKQESSLSQEYQLKTGAMTVMFRGQERTLQQMSKFLEETDISLREEAWNGSTSRFLQDSPSLDVVYDRMVSLRDKIARNAGFDNYRDYIFLKKFRFDYTPEDCVGFHRAVEEHFVPLSREIDRQRKEMLELDQLRPWDLAVDPEGRPPLRPFSDPDGLVQGCLKVLGGVDPAFSKYFSTMSELGLLDLDSRKGKAPGGYQDEFTEHGLPFIFLNAAARDGDMRTMLHESGHSVHTFLMHEAGLPYYNANGSLPHEIAEVASTTMELIGSPHIEVAFYDEDDARRSNREELQRMVKLFTWVATVDSFQHWVYTHPVHSHEDRARAWVQTFRRFSGLESYEGLEDSLDYRWQRQLHIFEVPFYYIEYGIASMGALGIWLRYKEDRASAIEGYKAALSLGASRPLPELFESAGVEWGMGQAEVRKLANELGAALKELA